MTECKVFAWCLSMYCKAVTWCLCVQYPIQGPYRTRITTYLRGNHHQLFIRLVECFLKIHDLHENGLSMCFPLKDISLVTLCSHAFLH